MAMAVAISPWISILLLYILVQITLAQQCLNNGYKNSAGVPQKTSCGLNQIAQNGLNFNSPQQGNMQQVNYQQQSNIQQAPFTQQASNQPQLNLQQGTSQQFVNSISNSQLLKQPNQDVASNIFSALYNIQQSSQNQRGTRNIVQGNPPQQMNYQQLSSSQNQPNPTLAVSTPMNLPQNNQPPITNSEFQPSFTFKFVPVSDVPEQPNQQTFALPIHKVSTNNQNQNNPIQNQRVINSLTSHQATAMQSPIVTIPGTQTNTVQKQPMVLSFQSPQASTVQNQPALTTTQTNYGQPIIYTVQTQPSSGLNQNQQISEVPRQKQVINNPPVDKQSLISYVMSQMQNPQGNGNTLASILPAMLNTKSERSSSMNSLLPLILNVLNEKKSCCGCPHCGCTNNNNNNQPKSEPIITTGYSNHINYSQQKPAEAIAKMTEHKSVDSTSNDAKQEEPKNVEMTNNTTETEEEEANDYEEEYDEE